MIDTPPFGLGATGIYLRQTAKRLADYPTDEFIEGMFLRMRAEHGVGLAAPQIDIPVRVAVIEYDGLRLVLSDPKVESMRGLPNEVAEEGCLSLPGRTFRVERAAQVRLRQKLRDGTMDLRVSGHLARIIQHETDHLWGILIDQHGVEVLS